MPTLENKELVRRFVEEVLNRANPDAAGELLHPDFAGHYPGMPPVDGLEAWKQLASAYFSAFPDLQETVEDAVAEDDRVVYRVTWRATHTGDLMGIPPTGRRVSVAGMRIVRIADGKIAEQWGTDDTLGMMQQLGIAP